MNYRNACMKVGLFPCNSCVCIDIHDEKLFVGGRATVFINRLVILVSSLLSLPLYPSVVF